MMDPWDILARENDAWAAQQVAAARASQVAKAKAIAARKPGLGQSVAGRANVGIGAAAMMAASGLLDAVKRDLGYTWNAASPNVAPSPEQIIEAQWRGMLDTTGNFSLRGGEDVLADGLRRHGIVLQAMPGAGLVTSNAGWDPYWRAVRQMHYPWPAPDALEWLLIWGVITPDEWRKLLVVTGHGDPNTIRHLGDRRQPPSVAESMLIWGADWDIPVGISHVDTLDRWARMRGELSAVAGADPDRRLLWAAERMSSDPGHSAALASYWRGAWTADDYADYTRRQGSGLKIDQLASSVGRDPLPGVSALLGLCAHQRLDNAAAADMGWDQEAPPDWTRWAKWSGYGWADAAAPKGVGGEPLDWGQLIWRGHWRDWSPAELMRGLHRLSNRDVAKWRKVVSPNVRAFDLDQVKDDMADDNVPPGMRDTLVALGYASIGIRPVQRIIRLLPQHTDDVSAMLDDYGGVTDTVDIRIKQYAAAQARDSGMSPPDAADMGIIAQLQAQDAITAAERRRQVALDRKSAAQWISLYRDGLASGPAMGIGLSNLGWTDKQITQAQDTADRDIDLSDLRVMVGRIRSDYFAGEYTQADALVLLTSAGIQTGRAQKYVTRWQAVFHRRRRWLETAKIQQMVKEGLMTVAAATVRLANLGWTGNDILLLEAETAQQVVVQQQRLAAQSVRQHVAAIKATQAALKAQQAYLARMMPPARMKRLLAKGTLNVAQVAAQLAAQGWSPNGIAVWMEDNVPERTASKGDIDAAYKAGTMERDDALTRLEELGYDDADATLILDTIDAKQAAAAATGA